jgi:excisionase family DNA binding protein
MDIRSGLPRFSLTPDEAAESTGFSKTRIFQAIRSGELAARKGGKATIVETDELLRWLRSLPARTCAARSGEAGPA